MIEYPKIIELFGLPRTGKTTTASSLLKYCTDRNIKTHLIKERAGVCPVKDKLSPLFNLWTASSYLKEYIEATEKGSSLVISDRGIIDALIWINSFNSEEIYYKEYNAVLDILNFDYIKSNIILAVYCYADIELVIEREYGKLSQNISGRIINKYVLTQYCKSYTECFNIIPVSNKIKEINTRSYSPKKTLEFITMILNNSDI